LHLFTCLRGRYNRQTSKGQLSMLEEIAVDLFLILAIALYGLSIRKRP